MKIKNGQMGMVISFLDEIDFTHHRKASLGRTKLKEKLIEKNEVFGKDQQEIIDEYNAWTDKEKLQYKLPNEEAKETMNELLNQEVDVTYNSPFRKHFVKAIEKLLEDDEEQDTEIQVKLQGQNADAFAILYEQLIEEKENK